MVEAHRTDRPVKLVGNLKKEGRAWTLRRPHELSVMLSDDEE
jgi:hypothetical protein